MSPLGKPGEAIQRFVRMGRMKNFLPLLLLLCGSAFAAETPNIVFILADDMGYGDVRALNPESKIPTPHLDALAKAWHTRINRARGGLLL